MLVYYFDLKEDAGGPLICSLQTKSYLIGILTTQKNDNYDTISSFINVTKYSDWIEKELEKNKTRSISNELSHGVQMHKSLAINIIAMLLIVKRILKWNKEN